MAGKKRDLTKILIQDIHGGRKEQAPSSSSNFEPWSEGNTNNGGQGKKRTLLKIFIVCCVLLLTVLMALLFFRSSYIESGPYSEYAELVERYFNKLTGKLDIKPISIRSSPDGSNQGSQEPRHYSFSESDIEKAKQELLEKRGRKMGTDTGNSSLKQFLEEQAHLGEDERYLYDIDLHSGGRVTAQNLTVENGTISYTSVGGLLMSFDVNEVKGITRHKIPK